jgi:hypothetical protein
MIAEMIAESISRQRAVFLRATSAPPGNRFL